MTPKPGAGDDLFGFGVVPRSGHQTGQLVTPTAQQPQEIILVGETR